MELVRLGHDIDPGGDLLVGPQGVAHLTLDCVVVHHGWRGAEDVDAGVGGVGVDVAHAPGQLDLQQRVESVLTTVGDLRLDLKTLAASHQVGINPDKNSTTSTRTKQSKVIYLIDKCPI